MKSYSINLKEDSIYQLFIKIAIPSTIGTIFQNLYSVVDSIFAGKMISTFALAAIGQIFPIYFVIIALGIGLGIGSTSLIANNIGSNNLNKAAQVFAQTIVLSIIVAIIISFIGINFSEIIIRTINDNQKTLNYSTQYINIIFNAKQRASPHRKASETCRNDVKHSGRPIYIKYMKTSAIKA